MTITALPTAPSRSDTPANFILKADALLAALSTLVTEMNVATAAMNLNATSDTSASSVAIGTGAKTFTVSASKSFLGGMFLVIADTAAPSTNWMLGQVTSYSGTTLVMNILAVGGSGTKTAWMISQTTPVTTNESRGSVAMHATTMDLWAQPDVIDGTGSPVTVTAIANAPQAGARRTLYPVAGSIITNGATFAVDGAASHTAAAGDKWEFEAITTSTYKVHVTKKDGTAVTETQIQPITASIASNAITIVPSALSLDFRHATLTNGAVTKVSGTPANLVIAATDSFGLVTAAGNQRLAILALNNAGTIELAAASLAGGVSLDETGVITTATAATLGTHIKAANVHTGVAYRVIGYLDATFTTATGWGSLALVQGAGGNAAVAMGSLGYSQTRQDVTGSRAAATTYYNTTGRPIELDISAASGGAGAIGMGLTVAGVTFPLNTTYSAGGGYYSYRKAVVPPGASYSVTLTSVTLSKWLELR